MSVDALVDALPIPHPPFRLILIDEDAVFRLGLRVWLERYADFRIVADLPTGEAALQFLANRSAAELSPTEATEASADLVILDMGLGRSQPDRLPGLVLCQRLRRQYPTLPLLLLSTSTEPILRAAAEQAGATGYCPKQLEPEGLVNVIRRVASGRSFFWSNSLLSPPLPIAPTPSPSPPLNLSRLPPLIRLRRHIRQSGIRQIDAALTEVNAELLSLELSLVDRAILAGRQRELRTARKLVSWLLATPNAPAPAAPIPEVVPPPAALPNAPPETAIATQRSLQSVLFDTVLAKLQTNLENATETPLETDILRQEKKRELFYLVLRKLEDLLQELRYSEVLPEQLTDKRSALLLDLWQAVTTDFFGKYYTVALGGEAVEVVQTLLQDAAIVQTAILNKIPGVVELIQYLLFQVPLAVDSIPYAPGNPESLKRAELLTENLLIQMSNAVVQPVLNRFASVESIKQTFYSRRLLSNREIERFRNDLSWKYRIEQYFREPQNIFESQYPLYAFSGKGLRKTSIYAPRNAELEDLAGVQLAVTLALETRDAIAPRLRAVVSFVGNGVIYVLTEVVGRGLGLVGRGILKGLGNAWQDSRMRR
ncbi:MAG TPA: DUF3685 domain-containing protein [Coleofasciculaceae cyanobacterium]